MKKGLLTALCLVMLCVTSCGRTPPLPPDDYGDITTTTAAVVSDTVTVSETTPAPEIAPEPAPAETSPPATNPPATNPPETIAPPSTAPSETLPPSQAGTAGKHYTYVPPSYNGLTLHESVDYNADGRIWASSHLADDKFHAGFVIDYIPGEYLAVSYTTDESLSVYAGKHPMLDINLTEDKYGETYIGETLNGSYNGEGYVFTDFYASEVGWYTYIDGDRHGTAYTYDNYRVFIEEYKDDKKTSSTEILPTQRSDGVYVNVLSEDGSLDLYDDYLTLAFERDGIPEYFGFMLFDGECYHGQISAYMMNGLGIISWDDGDVLIGQFVYDTCVYGLMYTAVSDQCWFVKDGGSQLTPICEIKGLDIDFDRLYGVG